MRRIRLTQGKFALVDDEDYEYLNQWKWCANKIHKTFYAQRKEQKKDGTKITRLMHRIVLGAESGQQIDHKNRNGLDNRRKNLRFCTQGENLRNRGLFKNNTSGYKGVYYLKKSDKWYVAYMKDGSRKIRQFRSKKEAVSFARIEIKRVHGEYAKIR